MDFMTALGHRIDAEVAAASEAISEGRLMSEADVDRHYRRLYPEDNE